MRFVCPTMHAEHLHMEPVWAATRATLERSRLRWTMFIDPLLPRIEGIDIAPVLAWIADHGHEVAMHTHHHKLVGEPGHTTGFVLGEELSRPTSTDASRRTSTTSPSAATSPKASSPGVGSCSTRSTSGWPRTSSITTALCARTPRRATGRGSSTMLRVRPRAAVNGLLEVPTTSPITPQLTATVLRSPWSVALGNLVYDLYYLHDYDLVKPHKRMAARFLDRLAPKRRGSHCVRARAGGGCTCPSLTRSGRS